MTQSVRASGTTTFGYDNNGNTTTMVQPGPITTTYGYDYENRLVSVAKPGYSAAYTYSADGLRLRVQESNNPNPDRWMQYDGVRPVLESLLDGQGNLQTILAKYVWEGDSYYDPLVFGYIGGAWRHPLYDGLGSTRQLIKQSDQTVTDTYQYEAFGNLLASTGTTPNPYRYVGSLGYYQTGASLQHLGARYYMPESGRFAARDPLPGASVYAYVRNSPVAAVDASGLSPIVQGGKEIDCGQPECDPQRDRGALLTRMETVAAILAPGGADYLNELTHGGGISLATTKCFQNPDKISAITQCQAPYQGLASSVESCVRVHERVHRMQCLAHGASWFNDPANDWVAEKEAYYAEFQCLQGLLLRAGIWVF